MEHAVVIEKIKEKADRMVKESSEEINKVWSMKATEIFDGED